MNSKLTDLVAATEAAHRALQSFQLMQRRFAGLLDPREDRPIEDAQVVSPRDELAYFLRTHQTTNTLAKAFSEDMKWELAGLASSQGIRAGNGTFASGHEIIAEAGVIADVTLREFFSPPQFEHLVDSENDPDINWTRLPIETKRDFNAYWIGDRREFFLDLLWEMVTTVRFVDVLQLRGVIDCEFAIARRMLRKTRAGGPYPRTRLSPRQVGAESAFTGQISFSPSSRPSVLRFLKAIRKLTNARSDGQQLSLSGVYSEAGLMGESQTRAKTAAISHGYIDESLRLLSPGSLLLDDVL